MSDKLKGTKKCPTCGGVSYVDMWKSGPGTDPSMRKFMCSSCKTVFYVLISTSEELKYLDEQLGRR